jgi:hypothetical protein
MSKECDGRNLRNGKARWQVLLLQVVVKSKLELEKRDGDSDGRKGTNSLALMAKGLAGILLLEPRVGKRG